jgi:hypothetical protein
MLVAAAVLAETALVSGVARRQVSLAHAVALVVEVTLRQAYLVRVVRSQVQIIVEHRVHFLLSIEKNFKYLAEVCTQKNVTINEADARRTINKIDTVFRFAIFMYLFDYPQRI